MEPLVTLILAWMLQFAPPGVSAYSLVEVEKGAPAPCAETFSPRCKAPWYSSEHKSWVRVETYEEGLRRYKTIATAIAQVSTELAPTWKMKMTKLLFTVSLHESGFRRDIHTGKGKPGYARGDCEGPRNKPYRGTCRSWGLTQVLLPVHKKSRNGFYRHQLVGLTLSKTRRPFKATALEFVEYSKRAPGANALSYFLMYGGLRSLASARPVTQKRIRARVSSYGKLGKGFKLTERARKVLALTETSGTLGGSRGK